MPSDVSFLKRILNSKYTAIAILLIISIGVYFNTLPNEFVYDDEDQVLKNPWIRDIKHIPKIFLTNVWAFEGSEISNYYRPLMHILYMIDYHIFGLKPWGFHLTNIIFHAGVTLLVYLISSMLINQSQYLNCKSQVQNPKSKIKNLKSHPEQVGSKPKSKIQGSKSQILSRTNRNKSEILSPAFIAALLFAVHPIHTETVAWVGGIPELSFTLFYLLSFYLYIYPVRDKSLNSIKADGKWGNKIILSVFFFFLATLCKEPALTLPLLMLVYDYSFRKDTLPAKTGQASLFSSKTLYQLLKRYLPYLIASIIYFILRTYAIEGFAPLKRHAELSNYKYFINVFPLFTQYLEKLIFPINLNAFYVFHPISSIFQLKGIIALILTLVFIFLVYFFRKNKVAFLCLLWIVIPLLPIFYIPALGEATFAERYLYLPSAGFVVLAALAIERISHLKVLRQTVNYVIISILVILTGLYSAGTIKRNYIWMNNYSLWTDTVKKSPDGHIPHNNLGRIYYGNELIDKAIEHYQIALKLKPDYPEAHNNLGVAYSKQGEINKAIEHYQITIKLKPDDPEAHNNLGVGYFEQQRFEDAIKEYLLTLELKPRDANTHNNLGNAYAALGKFDEAIREYLIAIKLKPNHIEAHYNLGFVYSAKGLKHKAREEFKTVLQLRPDFTLAKEALKSVSNNPYKSQ